MIITRSPLRISLGGGSSDAKEYYSKYSGFVISAAINKYVYITVSKPFQKEIRLKYSELENCETFDEIRHPIIRETLRMFPHLNQIEITSIADIPSGTGLGSSSSFTTGLLKAIYNYDRKIISQRELAELACDIEINKLGKPIGKQDQYISSYGGITYFDIHPDGFVEVNPVKISESTLQDLEDNLLLFFTGFARSADEILADQKEKSLADDTKMITNIHSIKLIGMKSLKALEDGKTKRFAELMNEHWDIKKNRSIGMSNDTIDNFYDVAIHNGAIGGKLIGAGMGGFLMFMANNKTKLRQSMFDLGLQEVRFSFDFEGTKCILS